MTIWRQPFTDRVAAFTQRPLFLVLLCEGYGPMESITNNGSYPDYLFVDDDENWTTREGRTIILYDSLTPRIELLRAALMDTIAGSYRNYVYRGEYETAIHSWTISQTNAASILGAFSTSTLAGADGFPYYDGYADFPSGGGCSLDRHTGRTQEDDITVYLTDHDGVVTKLMSESPIIGETILILGGYETMKLSDYVMIGVGRVASVNIQGGSRYEFTVGSPMKNLEQKLFRETNDLVPVLSGSMTAGQTTLPLVDYNQVPWPSAHHDTGPGYAAYMIKRGTEIMRITSSSSSADNVARGQWGTTATTHSGGGSCNLFFGVEDNPIDILLGLLLTRRWDMNSAEAGVPNYAWPLVQGNDALGYKLGLGLTEAEVNVESFESIRDDWFADDVWRLYFDDEETMRSFIEEKMLRVLGLNLYIDRTGRLALCIDKPPIAADVVDITEDDIIGIPEITFDNSEILNDVTLTYDYSFGSSDPGATVRVVDAASQIEYDKIGALTLDGKAITADLRGDTIAPRYTRAKMRNFLEPNPVIPISCLITMATIEPGDVVAVTHSKIPDLRTGKRGIADQWFTVIGKRIGWDRGTVDFELVRVGYHGKRYGLIAPNTQVDYMSATTEQKNRYCFISDDADDKMSNDDPGYLMA